MVELGHKLKLLRETKGLTQKDVAKLLNIDRSTYAYYETGKSRPDVYTLKHIADIYQISMDQIVSDQPQKADSLLAKSLPFAYVISPDGDEPARPEPPAENDFDKHFMDVYHTLSEERKRAVFDYMYFLASKDKECY